MKKHKFNNFPEMTTEEFNRLKADMQTNGFDSNYPILLYDNAILDGWNRYMACLELKIKPGYVHFAGNDEEALALVMRSNKKRNLPDKRLAALALLSDDLSIVTQKQVEGKRREKLTGRDNAKKERTTTLNSDSSISKDKNENTTDAKIAETIGVKRNMVANMKKLKNENPERFEKVAAGIIPITKILTKVGSNASKGDKEYIEENLKYFIEKEKNDSRRLLVDRWFLHEDRKAQLRYLLLDYILDHFDLYELYLIFFRQSCYGLSPCIINESRKGAIEDINGIDSFAPEEAKRLKQKVWDMNPILYGLIHEFIHQSNLFWDVENEVIVLPHLS